MSFLDSVTNYSNGVGILREWLGHGATPVEQELAQSRADVCIECPLNKSGFMPTEAMAAAIKRQVELKSHLKLRVTGEKKLHACESCSCALKLKVWIPIDLITPDEELRARLHPLCWLLSESK